MDPSYDFRFDPTFADTELAPASPGSEIAVLWLLGSLCPITRSHVLSLTEGRALLMGRPMTHPLPLAPHCSPLPEPRAAACLALVGVNRDSYVGAKFARLGEASFQLSAAERTALAASALSEHSSWAKVLPPGMGPDAAISALAERHSSRGLRFVPYEVSGADDCLRYCKWRYAGGDGWRLYVPLRSPDPQDPDTVALLAAVSKDHHDAQRQRGHEAGVSGEPGTGSPWPPHVVVGPGLPPHSSTQARAALKRGDAAALAAILPDAVAAWLLARRE